MLDLGEAAAPISICLDAIGWKHGATARVRDDCVEEEGSGADYGGQVHGDGGGARHAAAAPLAEFAITVLAATRA